MIDKYAARAAFTLCTCATSKSWPDGGFEESAHFSACGSLDIVRILDILHRHRFNGYLRPDHGRMIWGETGRPGYGLYDRALGASYINGIWETLDKLRREETL